MEKTYWIDTHCHMNESIYRDNLDEYMQKSLRYNVGRNMVICMNREDLEFTFEMQKKYPFIDIAYGYHPEDADKITEEDIEYMESIISDDRAVEDGELRTVDLNQTVVDAEGVEGR